MRLNLAGWILTIVAATTIAVAQAGQVPGVDARTTDGAAATLEPLRVYTRAGGPVPMRVARADPDLPLTLLLLNHRQRVVGPEVDVVDDVVDAAALIPGIHDLRRAGYLQLMGPAGAIGSPVVVQPLMDPMRPVVETFTTVDGELNARVTGWVYAPPTTPGQQRDDERSDESGTAEDDADDAATERDTAFDPDDRPVHGLRLYIERDVVLRTTHGMLRIALQPDEAPNTVWRFRELVGGGLYDGLTFHRIIPLRSDGFPFIVQGGDPAGNGRGGPGFHIPLEPSAIEHDLGVVSLARGERPDSAGSQFFICLSREGCQHLDGQFAGFGYVVDGLDTLLAIADVELADVSTGRPVSPPRIDRAELVPAPPRTPGVGRPDHRIALPEPEPEEPAGRVGR